MQKTVLILDDDLGFSMWLGRALNEAGIRSVPAASAVEALAIVADGSFDPIELMIANFKVDGCREVLETLAIQNSRSKVISIGSSGKRTVDGTIRRPTGKSLPPPDRYVKTVRDVLAR